MLASALLLASISLVKHRCFPFDAHACFCVTLCHFVSLCGPWPTQVLNAMMAALTAEMEEQQLTIQEVIGQGGFGESA